MKSLMTMKVSIQKYSYTLGKFEEGRVTPIIVKSSKPIVVILLSNISMELNEFSYALLKSP